MARIERHPNVSDYILSMSLDEIRQRGGVSDIFEEGKIVLLKDYRLDFDFDAISNLATTIGDVEDKAIRRTLKKLQATSFFEKTGNSTISTVLGRRDESQNPVLDVLCKGNQSVFERAANAIRSAHEEILRIFSVCFPTYDAFRFIPSLRLTQTLFENLHWDNHSIDDDFHQARIFANLDTRPRIWHVSHNYIDYARQLYREHDLGRFAGKDPNLMLDYINGEVLGGTQQTWREALPKHRIAFDPGEVWIGESRMISHQIFYGERAMVYMWFVKAASMANPENRFNNRVEALHQEMANDTVSV
jgi:hypothetical protein